MPYVVQCVTSSLLGCKVRRAAVEKAIAEFDLDRSGKIERAEFSAFMVAKLATPQPPKKGGLVNVAGGGAPKEPAAPAALPPKGAKAKAGKAKEPEVRPFVVAPCVGACERMDPSFVMPCGHIIRMGSLVRHDVWAPHEDYGVPLNDSHSEERDSP